MRVEMPTRTLLPPSHTECTEGYSRATQDGNEAISGWTPRGALPSSFPFQYYFSIFDFRVIKTPKNFPAAAEELGQTHKLRYPRVSCTWFIYIIKCDEVWTVWILHECKYMSRQLRFLYFYATIRMTY